MIPTYSTLGVLAVVGLGALTLALTDASTARPVVVLGVGALAGAFVIHPLRQARGAEFVVTLLTGLFGGAMLVVGLLPEVLPVALALPLAAPGFALAYAYADMLDPAGGLRIWLRDTLGADLPFEIRSVGGAAFVLSCAFMPYVYLAMRAAFLNQSVAALEAARLLGAGPEGEQIVGGLRRGGRGAHDGAVVLAQHLEPGANIVGVADGRHDPE